MFSNAHWSWAKVLSVRGIALNFVQTNDVAKSCQLSVERHFVQTNDVTKNETLRRRGNNLETKHSAADLQHKNIQTQKEQRKQQETEETLENAKPSSWSDFPRCELRWKWRNMVVFLVRFFVFQVCLSAESGTMEACNLFWCQRNHWLEMNNKGWYRKLCDQVCNFCHVQFDLDLKNTAKIGHLFWGQKGHALSAVLIGRFGLRGGRGGSNTAVVCHGDGRGAEEIGTGVNTLISRETTTKCLHCKHIRPRPITRIKEANMHNAEALNSGVNFLSNFSFFFQERNCSSRKENAKGTRTQVGTPRRRIQTGKNWIMRPHGQHKSHWTPFSPCFQLRFLWPSSTRAFVSFLQLWNRRLEKKLRGAMRKIPLTRQHPKPVEATNSLPQHHRKATTHRPKQAWSAGGKTHR